MLVSKKIAYFSLLLLCYVPSSFGKEKSFNKKIASVSVIGLERTDRGFLSRFIQTKKGKILKKNIIEQDIQRLKNLEVFHRVTYQVKELDDHTIQVIIQVEEKFTILPVLRGGFINNIFWIQPGFIDYHFLGNKSLLGIFYRYYQRHSVEGFYKNRFLFNNNWGLSVETAYLATIEPVDIFELNSTSLYNTDIIKINTTLNYNLSFDQTLQFTVGYLRESYLKISPNTSGPDRLQEDKLLLKVDHYLDKINYDGALHEGFSNLFIVEGIYNIPTQFDFFKIYNEYRHFFQFFDNDTLALRNRFGISSNFTSIYPPFVIDSFLNIRGAGNRTHRGYIENTINVEYRYLFALTSWLSVQVVGFSDNALLLSLKSRVLFFTYAGGGVRVILPKIYNGIVAFDYAINLQNKSEHGFLLKIGQYF